MLGRPKKAPSGSYALKHVLGGSWVVISGVRSPLIWVISIVTLLRTLLITTHEPPSKRRSKTRDASDFEAPFAAQFGLDYFDHYTINTKALSRSSFKGTL